MVLTVRNRPIRTVLRWQLIVTATLAVAAGILWGPNGAVSAALGGIVNLVAGWGFGLMVSRRKVGTAGDALRTMVRAEAVKVVLIVLGLWLVLTQYRDIVHAGFFAAFVTTVVVFAAAFLVPEAEENKTPRNSGDA